MGEEETGIEKARLFLEGHSRVWNGWFLLGWGLRKLGRWEDARAAFTQALELGKEPGSGIEAGYVDLCNELAICLMELGEYAESRRWLVAALAEEGENTKVMSNLGMLAMREGKKDEAAGFFRSILEFDPKDRIAREMLESLEG
jgi:Flp pilus assembly protein TadD